MIKVYLNDLTYRYDVFQIINIYFSLEEITFVDSIDLNPKIIVKVQENIIFISDEFEVLEYNIRKEYKLSDEIKLAVFGFLKRVTKMVFPWGTMLGIRPSKIALKLLKQGYNEEKIVDYYYDHYLASWEKSKLCIDIAKLEEKYVNTEPKVVSVYVGMPFCPTRCAYCSFASNPISSCSSLVDPYLEALNKELLEMSSYIHEKGLQVQCVYFGGGTPTSVNEEQFEKIMKAIYDEIIIKHKIEEFTVECGRPDSITYNKLLTMKKYNVNRISINPQSMNDSTLKRVGRAHSGQDVIDKFTIARGLGFDNINMDIIVGLEDEGLEEIDNTVRELEKLDPDSITVHGMAVKRASKIRERIFTGEKVKKLSQDMILSMFKRTEEIASSLEMKPYYMYRQKNMLGNMENVGYAKTGKESLYNIQMIEEKQTIIALGADAASKVVFINEDRLERFINVKDVKEYVSRIDEMIEKKKNLLNSLYNLNINS